MRDQLRWSHDLIDRTSPITSGMCEQRHRTRQSTGNIWELFGNLQAVRKTGKSYMTFCAIPWIHRHTNEQGFHMLCCVGVGEGNSLKNAQGERLHVSQQLTDGEVLNSPTSKTVRRQMMRGEWPAACERCRQSEQAGSPAPDTTIISSSAKIRSLFSAKPETTARSTVQSSAMRISVWGTFATSPAGCADLGPRGFGRIITKIFSLRPTKCRTRRSVRSVRPIGSSGSRLRGSLSRACPPSKGCTSPEGSR